MKFPEVVLRLVNCRTHEKDGKRLTFVKLADEKTFDSNEFILTRDQEPDFLVTASRYRVVLEVDGKYTSVHLTPEKTA